MSKAKVNLEALKKKAKGLLEKRSREKNLVFRGVSEDLIPSSGKTVFRMWYNKKDKPNSTVHALVVDEDGRELDADRLAREEGKTFFVPALVPDDIVLSRAKSVRINPTTNDLTLNLNDTFSEIVTVSIPKNTGAKKIDVYILADTTGSMGGILDAVKAGANNIVATLSGAIPDIVFGVGNYRDFPGDPADVFRHQLAPTNVAASVIGEINTWAAGGGGDTPEGQLFALQKLAEAPGGTIGWRDGSKRIIVWFGDAPGHDPVCAAISGEPADITEGTVTNGLVNEDISVIAISTSEDGGLDADPTGGGDYNAACGAPGGAAGQASRIADATDGAFEAGINPDSIVTTIIDLVNKVANSIENLKLVPSGATAPFVNSITPAAGYGPLSGDENHVLSFEVRFRGIDKCALTTKVYNGSLDAMADGINIISKPVKITVPPCESYRYTIKFISGVQNDFQFDLTSVRPGKYSTSIDILNFGNEEIDITRKVYPLVKASAAVGREPGMVGPMAVEVITLPPRSASMTDDYRLAELVYGAIPQNTMPMTSGILEITSPVALSVKAVHTATDLESGLSSMDIEQVVGDKL